MNINQSENESDFLPVWVAGLVMAGLLLSRMLAGPLVSMAYPSVME